MIAAIQDVACMTPVNTAADAIPTPMAASNPIRLRSDTERTRPAAIGTKRINAGVPPMNGRTLRVIKLCTAPTADNAVWVVASDHAPDKLAQRPKNSAISSTVSARAVARSVRSRNTTQTAKTSAAPVAKAGRITKSRSNGVIMGRPRNATMTDTMNGPARAVVARSVMPALRRRLGRQRIIGTDRRSRSAKRDRSPTRSVHRRC